MKKIISILLTLTLCLSLTSFAWATEDVTGTNTIDLAEFVRRVEAANYVYDGGNITVQWSPVSGCYDNREGHTCTVENVPATANTAKRVNNGLTQFQLYEGESHAVSVKNVHFVYIPAAFTVCENSGWAGSFTAEQAPAGQLYLMNTGDVTFEGCTFDKVVLTSFECAGTTTITGCQFSNVYNNYAIKDVRGANVIVTGNTITNCGGGIMVSSKTSVDKLTISGNTFSDVDVAGTAPAGKVGTRALIQIASSGTYTDTTFDFSGNNATNCGPALRQLNDSAKAKVETGQNPLRYLDGTTGMYTDDSKKSAIQSGMDFYDTIEEALAAMISGADGTTLMLLDDITVSAPIEISKHITINLNGKTITGTDGTNGCRVFNVVAGGKLELTGEGVVTTGAGNFNPDSSVIRVGDDSNSENSASLSVGADVTISAPVSYGVAIFGTNNGQTLTVDGKILAVDRPAISGNGRAELKTTQITINNGAMVSSANKIAIYHPQNGTLTINAATITGTGGIEAKAGTVIINKGAVITATAGDATHVRNDGDPSTNGYALAVVQNPGYKSPAKVTVKGGTFVGPVAALNDEENADADKTTLSISGGSFTSDPTDYLAAGYETTKNANGVWTVTQIVTPDPTPVDPQPERPAHTNRRYPAANNTTTTTDTKKDNVTSARTFDAGIAMYVGMSLLSVAGSAVVIGKKKEF